MKRIKSNRILLPDKLFDGYIYFQDGRIHAVSADDLPFEEEYDATDRYVSAGFIDIHVHGGGGYWFSDGADAIVQGCNFHFTHGTTSICPTISAAELGFMAKCAEDVRDAAKRPELKATIIGTHLEGPYLSPKQAGAQCPEFIVPPKEEEYLPVMEKLGDSIARWSYAPENDEGELFAKALSRHSIVASAGHTDAIYPELKRAMENGCKLITHLYSATSTVTREHGFRRLGVIETAYLEDDLFVEIICDGKHLSPELIKLIYKIKGADKIALITDSLAYAGVDAAHGWMFNTEFIVEDGVCKLVDRSAFAGSIATADRLIRVAVKEAEIPLPDAVKMMTETPSKIMGLAQKGAIEVGKDADFVVFDEGINIETVFANGVPY